MSEWQMVKIGDFLKEREGRYKPDDGELNNIPRLDKIDFSGIIHLSTKPTKTDMIIVQPGDLVISGINVAKGAIAIWEGDHPIAATIHFSSYIFDKTKIDIDFFKRYLKSPVFIKALQAQVKGGIKTEIKANHLLPLQVSIPLLPIQQKIKKNFELLEGDLSNLTDEIKNQSTILSKLRQSILQEAIEGKLTADWRKAHSVRKGDAEYDAGALLEKIKEEKQKLVAEGKIRKEKSPQISRINTDKMPFAVPEGWVWCRLGEIADGFQYGTSSKSLKTGEVPVLRMGNVQSGKIDWTDLVYTSSKDEIKQYKLQEGDLLFNRTNSRELVGKTGLFDNSREAIFAGYLVRFSMLENIKAEYANILMNSKLHREWCDANKTDALGQSNINATKLRYFLFPLPPLAEQRAIVERVEEMLALVDEMEVQVKTRKVQAQGLLQAVLREAFEGDEND
ncbi:MAG: restriction endonuclease subunit S [Termitinemataceae bacterium]|nr:MAG: restriction endonuclease subunit S [Termitinemataceae bacterium]